MAKRAADAAAGDALRAQLTNIRTDVLSNQDMYSRNPEELIKKVDQFSGLRQSGSCSW